MRCLTHTQLSFILPGSLHRWSYSVNFNTGIPDILHGCGLLCSSNRCFGWASLYFPASRSLSQRERDVNRRPLSAVGTVTLYLASAPACAPRLHVTMKQREVSNKTKESCRRQSVPKQLVELCWETLGQLALPEANRS